MNKLNKKSIIPLSIMGIVLAGMIVGDSVCAFYAQPITNLLCGSGLTFDGEVVNEALAVSDELVQDICEEGIVLLKNENNTLPLASTNRKVNLFGWSSTDNGFLLTGRGSGAATIRGDKKVTLRQGLKNSGFEVNEDLLTAYTNYRSGRDETLLIEPTTSFYTADLMNQAKAFSDTAIITFTRYAGENMEIPYTQKKHSLSEDTSRTYLELSTEEEALIDLVTTNFDKVIVLLDLCNPIEMGFLNNDKIDACMFVGMLGQSGTNAIGKILTGEVNPSGKTVNTYVLNHEDNPSFANKRRNGEHIHYVEDIYVGYRWYETAFKDGFYGSKKYSDVVQYPFGFGLSYTSFDWEIEDVLLDDISINEKYEITKKTKVSVNVNVTNTGDVAGKDVVQLYCTPPYKKGEIEKAYVNLMAFEKTALLEPGQTQKLTLTFDLYDVASYDCYDRNNNGSTTYELDAGTYQIKLMNDAHTLNKCTNAETSFEINDTIRYKLDPKTKWPVKNRFTGDTAYAGVPIDGNTVGEKITYLSRDNFAETFPKTATPNRNDSQIRNAQTYVFDGYDGVSKPTQGVDKGLRIWQKKSGDKLVDASLDDLNGVTDAELVLNEELVMKLGASYNDPNWDEFLNQITEAELFNLVECSGYRNDAMVSIGKAKNRDYDGPSGIQMNVGHVGDVGNWTGFPSQMNLAATFNKALAFQFGRAIGNEANATGISGWYAPGANLHRSPFNGRYFEYYSEDIVLTGEMASYVIQGAKSLNVYCYLKHFVLSEMGINPTNLNVWVTEQALRETYLRPFEIAVKEGGANAMMSAFNRVGPTWAGGSKPLLTDILRTEWGFRGVVITDWSMGNGYMNPTQGVRAGNDTWLNPGTSNGAPLDRNNPTNVYLARVAAKNQLFTIFDTYVSYKNFDGADDMFNATIGIKKVNKVFAWWVPILVGLNVVVVGIIAWQLYIILFHKKKVVEGPEIDNSEEYLPTLNKINALQNIINQYNKLLKSLKKNKSFDQEQIDKLNNDLLEINKEEDKD